VISDREGFIVTRERSIILLLLGITFSHSLVAQNPDDNSIPEPTRLEAIATDGAAEIMVLGVARCRPSQSVRQAFCPAMYRQDGEVGVSISTAKYVYQFPSIEASDLADALAVVLIDAGAL
jgi:hypothetical protein